MSHAPETQRIELGTVAVLIIIFALVLFGFLLGRYSRTPEEQPRPPAAESLIAELAVRP